MAKLDPELCSLTLEPLLLPLCLMPPLELQDREAGETVSDIRTSQSEACYEAMTGKTDFIGLGPISGP